MIKQCFGQELSGAEWKEAGVVWTWKMTQISHPPPCEVKAVFREPEKLRLLSCSSLIVISAAKLNVNTTASWGKVETLFSWIMTLGFLLDILKLPCLRAAE